MSISPRVLKKGKNEFTVFHMNIKNNSNETIIGKIKYEIRKPNGKIDIMTIDRVEYIRGFSEINEYDEYHIGKDVEIGRYFVDARFVWGEESVLSETNKNDYFDVIE